MKKLFSISSGNGLGLSNTTHRIIGDGVFETKKFGQAPIKTYVNIATGNLIIQTPTINIEEAEGPIQFYWTYNSQAVKDQHWHFSVIKQLVQPSTKDSVLQLFNSDGSTINYTKDPNRNNLYFANQVGEGTSFIIFDETKNLWRHYDPTTHITEFYNLNGQCVQKENLAGHIEKFQYDNTNRLTAIYAASGACYLLDWSVAGMELSCIENNAVTVLRSYRFDAVGRLVQEDFPKTNYTVHYSYNATTWLLCSINQTDNTTINFDYDQKASNSKVTKLQYGTNNLSYLDYSNFPTVKLLDVYQNKIEFTINENNLIAMVKVPLGYQGVTPQNQFDVTTYDYENGVLKTIINADNSLIQYDYDPVFNLKIRQSGPGFQKSEWNYQQEGYQSLLISKVDYINADDSKTALVQRYVYQTNFDGNGHIFKRFEISPSGRVLEIRADAQKTIGSIRTYTNNTIDLSSYPADTAPAYSTMQQWVSNQKADQVDLTDYVRNARGQIDFKRRYSVIDNQGQGIQNASMLETLYQWNIYGDCTLEVEKQNLVDDAITTHSFDDLRREVLRIDPLKQTEQWKYDDAQQLIANTKANDRVEETTWNTQGETLYQKSCVLQGTQIQLRETKYRRNLLGLPLLIIPPTVETIEEQLPRLHEFYDRQQRLGYSISRSGLVTETQVNAAARTTLVIRYDKPIDIQQLYLIWPPASTDLPYVQYLIPQLPAKPGFADRVTLTTTTETGKLHYSIDADKNLTEIIYDNLDRSLATIQYTNPLTQEEWQALLAGKNLLRKPDPNIDRIKLRFFDTNSEFIAEQDAAGYVIYYQRDAAGRIQQKICFANPVSIDINFFNQLPTPIPDPKNDARTIYYYDAKGACFIEINSNGAYIVRSYYASGLLQQETKYAIEVDTTAINHLFMPLIPQTNTEDKITRYENDLLGRIITVSTSDGCEKQNRFSIMGEKENETTDDLFRGTALNPDVYRSQAWRYDGWGQLLAKANAYVCDELAQIENDSDLTPQEKASAIEKIWLGCSTRYNYDPTGLKLSTIDSFGNRTVYFYNDEHQLIVMINASGIITENTYNHFHEIIKTRDYQKFFPTLDLPSLKGGLITPEFRNLLNTLQNDALDSIEYFTRNNRGLVTQVIDAEGYVTLNTHNAFKECIIEKKCVNSTLPTLTITREYEPRGFETQYSQTAQGKTISRKRHYQNMYGKETEFIDENNGGWQTFYDPLGCIKETLNPEGGIQHSYIYDTFNRIIIDTNSLNETVTHSYNQQLRSEIITNAGGTYTAIISNIFKEKIKEDNGIGITHWEHTPDGKIARKIDALKNVLQTNYDLLGRKISQTNQNGIVDTFEYNAVRQLIKTVRDANPHGLKLITHLFPDAFGNDQIIIDPRGITTKNKFDRRNLLIQTIHDPKGLNLITEKTYNAQARKISFHQGDATHINQYQETYQIDDFNRDTGKIIDPNNLALATQQVLDDKERVIACLDPNNHVLRTFYDSCDRVRFVVDAEGGVYEREYWGSENRLKAERHYDTAVDPDQLTNQTTLVELEAILQQSAQDSLTYYYYDVDGCERFQVNSLGAVFEKRYDKANHLIEEIKYSTFFPNLNFTILTYEILVQFANSQSNSSNRIIYHLRDAKGQERYTINAAGYITGFIYDKVGNIVIKTCFATYLANPAAIAALPIDEVLNAITQNPLLDRACYQIFDSQNKPWFVVDGEGSVIKYTHDDVGNLIEICAFKKQVIMPARSYADLATLLQTWIVNLNTDRIVQAKFDNANRKISQTDPLGYIDKYQLDSLDNIQIHTDRSNNNWSYTYDSAKRLEEEISPEIVVSSINNPSIDYPTLQLSQKNQTVNKKTSSDNVGNSLVILEGANTSRPRAMGFIYDRCNRPLTTKTASVPIDDPNQNASYSTRPEKFVTVTNQIIYNVKGKKVVTQAENGALIFYIYDSEEQVCYVVNDQGAVIQYIRNAFGEIIQQTNFSTAIALNLQNFSKTGIPIGVIQAAIVSSILDRTIQYQRNNQGLVVMQQQGEILYYLSNENQPEYGLYRPTVWIFYNAFQQEQARKIILSVEQNSYTWEFNWYDRNGKKLAVCDAAYAVKRYFRDTYGQEIYRIEWGKTPSTLPDLSTSLQQLDSYYQPTSTDRFFSYAYNTRGDCISDTQNNVDLHQVNYDLQTHASQLINLPAQSLSKKYQYSPTQKQVAITNENDDTAYYYYDARNTLIALTEVPRQSDINPGIPLTYFYIDAFAMQIGSTRFFNGTAHADLNALPAPYQIDLNQDQTIFSLMNNRGLTAYKQDALGQVTGFTYTASKKLVRQWRRISNLMDSSHIDEERYLLDSLNQPIGCYYFRDGIEQTEFCTLISYDLFGGVIFEARTDGKPDRNLYRRFDTLGRVWSTNASDGVNKIILSDLSGKTSVILQSPIKDLSIVNYQDLSQLLTWQATDLEREEFKRDALGRVVEKLKPAYSIPDPNAAIDLPLTLIAGKNYPEFGKTSLTWVNPNVSNFQVEFQIWQALKNTPRQTLSIKTIGKRCGVDVSTFTTDLYQYQINYYLLNPFNHTPNPTPTYQTQGEIQFDTGINQNSQHLVVSVINDKQLILTGNINGITALELLQNTKIVAVIPVIANQTVVDLSSYVSGSYTVRPEINGTPIGEQTLPFTIYTATPSPVPLAKEIPAEINVMTLTQNGCHGQIIWQVPIEYQALPILFTCHYVDSNNEKQIYSATIKPGTDLGHYTDSKGNVLVCNTEFNYAVKNIVHVTACLQLDTQNVITIINNFLPQGSSGDGVSTILNTTFPTADVLYIVPMSGFSKPPTLQYIDTSLALAAKPVLITAVNTTNTGIVIDATGISPGIYPFQLYNALQIHYDSERPLLIAEQLGSNPIIFKEGIVTKNREHGFRLLNTTREVLVTILRTAQKNKEIKALLHLDMQYWIKHKVLAKSCRIADYLTALEQTLGLGFHTALAYAKVTGINLCLWQKKPGTKQVVLLADSVNHTQLDIRHICVTGQFHYDVLLLPDTILESDPSYSFTLNGGGFPYNSNSLPPPPPVNQLPSYNFQYDHWDNAVSISNTLQQQTLNTYNSRNKKIQSISPAVFTMLSDGSILSAPTVKQWHYDALNKLLAEVDGNNNVITHNLDAAGQEIQTVLGDGVISINLWRDNFGRVTRYSNAEGSNWTNTYDQNNQLTQVNYPTGLFIGSVFNERGLRIQKTELGGNSFQYVYDIRNNITRRYQPMGQFVLYTFDRNNKLIEVQNPDASWESWNRDYFGYPQTHMDLSGEEYFYGYDNKWQLTGISSNGTRLKTQVAVYPVQNFLIPGFLAVELNPTGGQNLTFNYLAGNLVQVTDYTMNAFTLYWYDTEDREIALFFSKQIGSDNFGQRITTSYSALGEEETSQDNAFTAMIVRDAARNIRQVTGIINGIPQENMTYQFDQANRVVNINNQTLIYQNNFFIQMLINGEPYKSMQYDADGRLCTTIYEDQSLQMTVNRRRNYGLNGNFIYEESDESGIYSHTISLNDNYWQLSDIEAKNNSINVATAYNYNIWNGLPIWQNTNYFSYNIKDELQLSYTGYEDYQLTQISGHRYKKNKPGPIATAINYRDANGGLCLAVGLDDGNNDTNTAVRIFVSSHDGRILDKQQIEVQGSFINNPVSGNWFGTQQSESRYFYNAQQNIIGSVSTDPNQTDDQQVAVDYWQHVVKEGEGGGFFQAISEMALAKDPRKKRFDLIPSWDKETVTQGEINSNITSHLWMPAFTASYPPEAPTKVIAKQNDTFQSMANEFYEDPRSADRLAVYNNMNTSDEIQTGQLIQVAQTPTNGYRGNLGTNAQQFLNIMQGQLTPVLRLPKPHHSWLSGMIEEVVNLVGATIGFITAGPLGAALDAGLFDACYQEVALALHVQTRFNLLQLGMVAISAYLLPPSASLPFMQTLMRKGIIAVLEQLVAIETKLQRHFDFDALISQLSIDAIMHKVGPVEDQLFHLKNTAATLLNSETRSFSSGLLNQFVDGTPFNAAKAAESGLGSAIESEIGSFVTHYFMTTTDSQTKYSAINLYPSSTEKFPGLNRSGFFNTRQLPNAEVNIITNDQLSVQNPIPKVQQANHQSGLSYYPPIPTFTRQTASWESSLITYSKDFIEGLDEMDYSTQTGIEDGLLDTKHKVTWHTPIQDIAGYYYGKALGKIFKKMFVKEKEAEIIMKDFDEMNSKIVNYRSF